MPARHEQCRHTQARCNRQPPTRQHASCSDIYRAARLGTQAGSAHAIAHVQRAHVQINLQAPCFSADSGAALHSSLARPGQRRGWSAPAAPRASAELPAVAAVYARDESGHRLVRAARLHLVVLALALPALAALELVRRRGLHVLPALRLRERGLADAAVGRPALVAGQLLGRQLHEQRACGGRGARWAGRPAGAPWAGGGGVGGRASAGRSGRPAACSAPVAPASAAADAAPPGTAPGPGASPGKCRRVYRPRASITIKKHASTAVRLRLLGGLCSWLASSPAFTSTWPA
jgi:hypothetical protein